MRGVTRIWFLSAFFFFPLLCAETEYECGAHGRFEYCVDGIPACVVGCHCHPGYYFDTESKICEHNSKLTKGAFRRFYNPEPTRIPDVEIMTPPNRVSTTSTTSNPVEEKIDEITKDADDLGDWLYNQFFKTIENQVINKTQDEESSPSRRSGDQLNKPSRRSHHRTRRHKKKKKKSKSKSLKSKLLRITEDDSLFDSSSESGSNSEGSSSASTGESSASSKSCEKKDDGHDHKKLLIFNKKPQPPLPSFIFLPNMDSAFYPPMGMPAPPMPMYPMVPVPPMIGPQMGPPMFPYPGPPTPCDETSEGRTDLSTAATTLTTEHPTTTSTTTKSPATTAEPKTEEEPTTEEEPPPLPPDDPQPPDDSEGATDPPALRSRLKKKKNKIPGVKKKNLRPALRDRRNKLLKRLREKMNRKNKLENYYMAEQYQDPNIPLDEPEAEFESKNNLMAPYMHEMLPEQRDVDFKYLADLIHKSDLNKTLQQQPQHHLIPSNSANPIPKSIPGLIPLEPMEPIPNRRNNYYQTQILQQQPKNNFRRFEPRTQLNDTFYTDLGKQIASMIRKIDTLGDREVNIEIERPNRPLPQSPVFNENNYASRSFWERSVRSPMRHFASFRNELENIKRSNEDLFSLERKVEVVASTARTLSLHDLENIISIVQQKRRTQAKRNSQKSDNTNTSFKFDLLPSANNIKTNYDIKPSNNIQTISVKKTKNIKETIPPHTQKEQKSTWVKQPIARIVVNRKMNKDLKSFYTGISPIRKIKNTAGNDFLPKTWQQQVSPYVNAPPVLNNKNFNSVSDSKPNIKTQDVRPTRKPTDTVATPTKRILSYIMPSHAKGIHLNHRNHNNNFYSFQKNSYLFDDPMPMMQYTAAGLTKNILPNGNMERPSYFHHEFHHFDYID